MTTSEREPLDIRDYLARLHDRTEDYELHIDGARVAAELRWLRQERTELLAVIATHVCHVTDWSA